MAIDIQTWVNVAAFSGAGIAMGLGAIGAAIAEGNTAASANYAISRNPSASGEIFKSMLVGQAIAESAAIFALVVAMVLMFSPFPSDSLLWVFIMLAAGISMGFGAIGAAIGSGFPAAAACEGMARQPEMSGPLATNMLIGSAVCQTPAIFALVTSFILMFKDYTGLPLAPTWAAILGAGISTGLSTIGSGIGGGLIARESCLGMSRQPLTATTLTNTMLLGQAVTQTPAIYGLLISFMLIFSSSPATEALTPAMALLGAGICMGLGASGPALGIGTTGQSAVKAISRNLTAASDITRVMLIGMAVSESTGIYAMVISLCLIFVV